MLSHPSSSRRRATSRVPAQRRRAPRGRLRGPQLERSARLLPGPSLPMQQPQHTIRLSTGGPQRCAPQARLSTRSLPGSREPRLNCAGRQQVHAHGLARAHAAPHVQPARRPRVHGRAAAAEDALPPARTGPHACSVGCGDRRRSTRCLRLRPAAVHTARDGCARLSTCVLRVAWGGRLCQKQADEARVCAAPGMPLLLWRARVAGHG